MITISKEQFATIEAAFMRDQRERFARRLALDECVRIDEIAGEELMRQIDDGCKVAELLGILELDAVYRFLRLRYVPATIWERPGVEDLMMRVLRDTSLTAQARLDFVEKNIAFVH